MTTTSPSSAGVASRERSATARRVGRAQGLAAGGPGPLLRGLVQLARPRQWTKNLLVFAAPAAAGVLDNAGPAVDALIAFARLLPGGLRHVLRQRRPRRRCRPAPSDQAHPARGLRRGAGGVAYAGGAVLLAASVALAFAAGPELAATILGYVALTTAYSAVLKNVAVVDLVAVAAGFVLRAVAGATATDVPISDWFFIVTSFGALFIVSGKRGAEASEMAGATIG